MIGWSMPAASSAAPDVTTETTTSGIASPGHLGEFQMEEGHAYILRYRLNAMRTNGLTEQRGATFYQEYIYSCRWPTGGDPSPEEFTTIDQGLSGAYSLTVANGIDQENEETLGRVWIESTGLSNYAIAWLAEVFVISDREISA